MSKKRVILHCDLNNFYASVECKLNPSLKNIPMAVGGSVETRTGIILAKNNIAKNFGVVTAETIWQAKKKCKDLVIVPPNFSEYEKHSRLARNIYERYTDQVEPYGIDECWLDVTGSEIFGSGFEIAQQIKEEMKKELDLTISVGVSFNKVFAKLGSDMKKPDAVTVISYEDFQSKIWGLPVSELLGVGKVTNNSLVNLGVKTIGDLAKCSEYTLVKLFGKNGKALKEYANGEDNSKVKSIFEDNAPKSIGHGITAPKDLTCNDEVKNIILDLAQDIGSKLKKLNKKASGVSVGVKNSAFGTHNFQCQLDMPTKNTMEIANACYKLFEDKYSWHINVRAVTITAINLVDMNIPFQVDLFTDMHQMEKRNKVDNVVEELRVKFGKGAVVNASLLNKNSSKKINCDD